MSNKTDEQNKLLGFNMWIQIMYLDWQSNVVRGRASLDEFADYIGYSRSLVSMWMSGKRLPTEEGIKRLAELFGDEIYDVLGIPRPNPFLQKLNRIWENIPPDKQQQLVEQAEQFEIKNEEQLQEAPKRRKKTSHK